MGQMSTLTFPVVTEGLCDELIYWAVFVSEVVDL